MIWLIKKGEQFGVGRPLKFGQHAQKGAVRTLKGISRYMADEKSMCSIDTMAAYEKSKGGTNCEVCDCLLYYYYCYYYYYYVIRFSKSPLTLLFKGLLMHSGHSISCRFIL